MKVRGPTVTLTLFGIVTYIWFCSPERLQLQQNKNQTKPPSSSEYIILDQMTNIFLADIINGNPKNLQQIV